MPLVEALQAEELLETCRTRWQYGEWSALTRLSLEEISRDRSRAKVAVLVAAAHGQFGDTAASRRFAAAALDWGCSREVVARVLTASIHNSLARVATSLREDEDARTHFEDSVRLVEPRADIRLVSQTRRVRETARLGFLPEAAAAIEEQLEVVREAPADHEAELRSLASTLSVVKAEMSAAEKQRILHHAKDTAGPRCPPRAEVAPPFVVLVAGTPRSGSTWLYNAVRLLGGAEALDVYACWVADYDPEQRPEADVHLVKLHSAEQLTFPYHRLLTTRRNLDERLASLIRMGWTDPAPEAIRATAKGQAELHAYWLERTNLEISFEEIENAPETALGRIAEILDFPVGPADLAQVARTLSEMRAPDRGPGRHGHDATTLLHPGHRAGEAKREDALQRVRAALADPSAVDTP